MDSIFLGAGERIDAVVEMNNPGIWILGSTEKPIRESGLGVVVEYAGQHMRPQWIDPPKEPMGLHDLRDGGAATSPAPQQTIEMIFEKIPGGAGKFNLWLVNGKPYPHEREFVLQQGARYRLVMRNRTRRCAPDASASAFVGTAGHQRQADCGRDEGYGGGALLWARDGGFYGESAGAVAVSLPYPAAHGLWIQGAVSLRLTRSFDVVLNSNSSGGLEKRGGVKQYKNRKGPRETHKRLLV